METSASSDAAAMEDSATSTSSDEESNDISTSSAAMEGNVTNTSSAGSVTNSCSSDEAASCTSETRKTIKTVACSLGYKKLLKEQEESILQFALGKDVFISLPTGFGKSLCYIALPGVFDKLRGVTKESIVLVVSPLVALMRDQTASARARGVAATYISDKEAADTNAAIKNGEFQVIFISPEALLGIEWRNMLTTAVYRTNLVGFVVDEAHCIKKWGECFRREFSNLGEIRSLIPRHVSVMALTATAVLSTRRYIIRSLSMQNPFIIYVPPVKNNITYFVADKPKAGISEAFQPVVERLMRCKEDMGRLIIFCRTYENVINIHHYFRSALGEYYTRPKGAPNLVRHRVVDMYTHCTHSSVKSKILEQFTSQSSLRVIIATIAFGMGIDCPDVRQVIHWGTPEDAEMYVQESGRAGRDGKPCCALLMKNSRDLDKRYTSKQMIDYCVNTSLCRRLILFSDFPDSEWASIGCTCCDVCANSCKCGQCDLKLNSFFVGKKIMSLT